jgi:hypothetical protein
MPVGAQNDTVPVGRQCNLESFEENIILKFAVVRCGKILSRACRSKFAIKSADAGSPSVSAFPNGEWIALGCGRAGIMAKMIRKISVGTRNAEAQS